MSTVTAQQMATFPVAGCSSIGPECAGTPVDIYDNYGLKNNDAASTVVRAAQQSAKGRELEPEPKQLFV